MITEKSNGERINIATTETMQKIDLIPKITIVTGITLIKVVYMQTVPVLKTETMQKHLRKGIKTLESTKCRTTRNCLLQALNTVLKQN